MKKLTNNFYSLTRKGKKWTPKQVKIIKKHLHYNMFNPVPRDYIDTIFGSYNYITDECYYKPSDVIMFNFDVKNGKRMSIRGMTCISFDGVEKINSKEYKYYYIDLIGNNGLGSTPAAAVKRRHKVSTKSGKDMIEYWKRYGKKKHFSFFKLKSMEDVIGFYWKCGFRFNYSKKNGYLYETEKWKQLINRLNEYNNRLKRRQDGVMEKEKEEYSKFLERYFNKFMDGYYNLNYLSNKMSHEDFKYGNTLSQKHYDLRFQGYSMYYHF